MKLSYPSMTFLWEGQMCVSGMAEHCGRPPGGSPTPPGPGSPAGLTPSPGFSGAAPHTGSSAAGSPSASPPPAQAKPLVPHQLDGCTRLGQQVPTARPGQSSSSSPSWADVLWAPSLCGLGGTYCYSEARRTAGGGRRPPHWEGQLGAGQGPWDNEARAGHSCWRTRPDSACQLGDGWG